MSSERKLFGTDGIRGRANDYPMTGDVAFVLGRAITHYFQVEFKKHTRPLIVLGKDTRLSCYMLEQALAAGVCAQGGKVILTGPLPTPGVAFVTTSMRADAGVMISASHNPYHDNGIKVFDSKGFKLPDEVESELEALILNPSLMPKKCDQELGNAKRLDEVFGRYLVHAKQGFPKNCDMEGMRVVLDCANGAGYKVSPTAFAELGAEVKTLGVSPNGTNINDSCGSTDPVKACELVKKYRADLGVCLDGDGDRIVAIDERGRVVDGDRLIALFARLLLDQGMLREGDTVVGTIMSNIGLEHYINSLGLKFHRSQVGDRYIIGYMRKSNSILGGEPSGHIIFANHSTTGDGTLAALKLAECVYYYRKSVSQLVQDIQLCPQVVKSAEVAHKPPLEGIPTIQRALKAAVAQVGAKGRVVLRYSGTEPLARVMVEGEDRECVDKTCDELVRAVTRELGRDH